jgi:hypothetical protein
MTEPKPIKLELTLEELKLIDKYIEANDDTYSVLMKIKDAYPKQKSIRSIINRWWMDTFTSKNKWSVDECIDDLADQIEFFYMRNKND